MSLNSGNISNKYSNTIHYKILQQECNKCQSNQNLIQTTFSSFCIDYYFNNEIELSTLTEIVWNAIHFRVSHGMNLETQKYRVVLNYFTLPILREIEGGRKKTYINRNTTKTYR